MQINHLIIICGQLTLYCANPNDSIHSATSWQLHCKNSMSSAECCHGNDNMPSFFKSKTNKQKYSGVWEVLFFFFYVKQEIFQGPSFLFLRFVKKENH